LENNVKLKLKDVEFSKSRFKTYFGNIGELITEEMLLKRGFEVLGMKPYHAGKSGKLVSHSEFSLWHYVNILHDRETYGVIKSMLCYSQEECVKAINQLNIFFGDKLVNFVKYVESIGMFNQIELIDTPQISAGNEVMSKRVYTPDMVAKKNGEIYIVEVKANSGNIYLKPEKVKGLLSARKFGLIPLVVHINVNISATDFSVEELS
jgi:hypothetical protein